MVYYTSYKLTIDSSFIDEKNEKSKQTEIDAVMDGVRFLFLSIDPTASSSI